MGESIPLRWLKFEKAKAATKEGMMKMSQVIFCLAANKNEVITYHNLIQCKRL